jgi:hypothetical protein
VSASFERIPAELRERDQWVPWRYEERDGKRTKVPRCADGGPASSIDPATWATFQHALAAVEPLECDGIGYVFSADDPFVGVDLDDGLSEAERAAIVEKLASYTETSVSGSGVHIFVRASLNGRKRNRKGPFEVYEAGRYFVVTGEHVQGTPATIEERQAELDAVLDEYLPEPEVATIEPSLAAELVDLEDEELLELARVARNGEKFRRLWEGDWSGYRTQSEADLALCSMLAFRTGPDPARIDRLFRASGLMRPKWERDDYRQRTIAKAIESSSEVYEPKASVRSRGSKSVDSDRGVLAAPPTFGVAESAYKDSATPDADAARVSEAPGTESDSAAEADSVDSDRVFALPIREFVALEREQREPMLADSDGRAVIGFRSLVLVGALGGHGKTTWSLDLFLHMVAGIDYPPFRVPRPVSILIVENEGPEELFAAKLESRLEHFPHELKARLDVCVFDWGGFSLSDATHRNRLVREIADKGYDLVFGDPLDSLGIEGVGSPDDTRKFLALMKETGLNKTVAWWLNTHPRKEETKEALNEIAGAWGGKPDTVFLLRLLDGDRTQIRQPKLRWARRGKGPTVLFAFDPDTEAFTFVGEQSEEERDYFSDVRALLADGKWRIVKEIIAPAPAGIGASDEPVKKALEEHPDVFEMRTGDAAKALGRKPTALLWQLRAEGDS